MSKPRNLFTEEDDELLIKFIARHNPGLPGRGGNALYHKLVDNAAGKWPWGSRHPWQSWRDRYVKSSDRFNSQIKKYQKRQGIKPENSTYVLGTKKAESGDETGGRKGKETRTRTAYTTDDDEHLVKFIAKHNPEPRGRNGKALYQKLAENAKEKWPWSVRHPFESWRERYVKNAEWFDEEINKCQKKGRSQKAAKRKNPDSDAESSGEDRVKEERVAVKRKRKRVSDGVADEKRRKILRSGRVVGKSDNKGEPSGSKVKVEKEESKVVETEAKEPEAKKNKERAVAAVAQESEEDGSGSHSDSAYTTEESRGPVGSEDYAAEVFGTESESEDEEDVGAMLTTDEVDSSTDHSRSEGTVRGAPNTKKSTPPTTPGSPTTPRPIYPDLGGLPSPHLRAAEPSGDAPDHEPPQAVPGAYDTSTPRIARSPCVKQEREDEGGCDLPREPTPPKSPPDFSVNTKVPSPRSPRTPSEAQRTDDQASKAPDAVPPPSPLPPPPPPPPPTHTDTAILPSNHPRTSTPSSHPSPKRKPKAKPRARSPNSDASDFFASLPPSPHDPPSHSRKLPQLLQGPFGNTLGGKRRRDDSSESGDDGGATLWPPVRTSRSQVQDLHEGEGKAKAQQDDGGGHGLKKKRIGRGVQTESSMGDESHASTKAGIFIRRPKQVNAEASSSRLVPPSKQNKPIRNGSTASSRTSANEHHPFTQPTQLPVAQSAAPFTGAKDSEKGQPEVPVSRNGVPKQVLDAGVNGEVLNVDDKQRSSSSGSPSRGGDRQNHQTGPTNEVQKPTVQALQLPDNGSKFRTRDTLLNPVDRPNNMEASSTLSRGSSIVTRPSMDRITALRHEDKNAFKAPLSRTSSTTSSSDPFVVKPTFPDRLKNKGKGKEQSSGPSDDSRRHTIGGATVPFIPRVDLRVEFRRSRPRQSLPPRAAKPGLQPQASPSRTGTPGSPAISVSASDRSIVDELGMNAAIRLISQNHGFREEVTWNVWKATRDLIETDEIMMRMRMKAEAVAVAHVEKMEDQRSGMWCVGGDGDVGGVGEDERSEDDSGVTPPRLHMKRNELQFTPAPVNDDRESEYSPPETSRAGEFARLVRQGRIQEALKRERRRASGGGRVYPRNIFMTAETPTPELQRASSSPENDTGHEKLEQDHNLRTGDAMEMEEPTKLGGNGDLRTHVVVGWGDAEDQMFRSAWSGSELALQEIEKGMDEDFMRQRVVDLISEMGMS